MDLAYLRWLISGWFRSLRSLWQPWSKKVDEAASPMLEETPPPPPPPPQPAAWMLLPYEHNCKELTFYDLCECRIRKLKLPKSARGSLLAASNGWLLLINSIHQHPMQTSLFDPISKTQIPLPPFPANMISKLLNDDDDDDDDDDDIDDFSQVAVSSSDASQCIVAVRFRRDHSTVLALCGPQDESWTLFKKEDALLDHMLFSCTDHGALYVMNVNEEATFETHSLTLGGGQELKLKIIPTILPRDLLVEADEVVEAVDGTDGLIQIYKQRCYQHYLVELKGRVLLVSMIYDDIRAGGQEEEEDSEGEERIICYALLDIATFG